MTDYTFVKEYGLKKKKVQAGSLSVSSACGTLGKWPLTAVTMETVMCKYGGYLMLIKVLNLSRKYL